MSEVDAHKIFKQLEARSKRANPYTFYDKDELIDEILKDEDEIERLNNKEEQLIRRLEDLIIVGEQVENEWAVDICKMIIKELKGVDKE